MTGGKMGKLEGKVAIVTGGAGGIGLAIAQRFVAEGAFVFVTDIDAAMGADAVGPMGDRARFIKHDVSADEAWRAVIEQVEAKGGGLDILVNNAGITMLGSVEDLSLENYDRTFAINTRGTFLGCRHAIALMKRKNTGAIVNIASVSGFKPMAELVSYNGSKAAVLLMTQSVALYGAKFGIRVNAINPGVINTAMLRKVMAQVPNPDELMDGYKALHPIGRIGEPEEIAGMAAYLCSDEAGFITGAAFNVAGGLGL